MDTYFNVSASEILRNNYDIVLAAVNQNAKAIQYASENCKMMKALYALLSRKMQQYFNTPVKDCATIQTLYALLSNKPPLPYASTTLRNNYDIVLAAVTQDDADCVRHAFQDNLEIACAALLKMDGH